MGTESYPTHQLNYFKHVNMQEAHRNDYYTNKALCRPLESLTIIHDKMDHAKTISSYFANRIKATNGFLSYMYQLWVILETISLYTLNVVVIFLLCLDHL